MVTATSSTVKQVAAREMHDRISSGALLLFESTTNDGLLSMSQDERLPDELRAFAGWELEYREAMGVYIDLNPSGQIRRTEWRTQADMELIAKRTRMEANDLHARVEDAKKRWAK